MINRTITIFLLLVAFAVEIYAAPNAPTINAPTSGSTIYTTKPWILFTCNGGGGTNVNNAEVVLSGAGSYDSGTSAQSMFAGLPAGSGAKVRFRVPNVMAAGSYTLTVYVQGDSGTDRAWNSSSVSFTLGTPTAQVSAGGFIKATDFNNLKANIVAAMNSNGAAQSWPTFSSALSAGNLIRAGHITDMRNNLNTYYAAFTIGSTPSYTDSISQNVLIRYIHYNQIRNKLIDPSN